MRKPIIGISTSQLIETNGTFAGYKRNYVNQDYITAVIKNGGIPMLIPFNEDEKATKEMIKLVDGLILSGGHDVFPINYKEQPLQRLGQVFPERDDFDTLLYKEARKRDIPILGICRGMQLINVIEGGTLYQDLSYRENTNKHSFEFPHQRTHEITVKPKSILSKIFDKKEYVNSFHHQVLNKVGKNLEVIATADDGVVEAYQHKKAKFVLGVQFHPEMLVHTYEKANKLFKEFISKC